MLHNQRAVQAQQRWRTRWNRTALTRARRRRHPSRNHGDHVCTGVRLSEDRRREDRRGLRRDPLDAAEVAPPAASIVAGIPLIGRSPFAPIASASPAAAGGGRAPPRLVPTSVQDRPHLAAAQHRTHRDHAESHAAQDRVQAAIHRYQSYRLNRCRVRVTEPARLNRLSDSARRTRDFRSS